MANNEYLVPGGTVSNPFATPSRSEQDVTRGGKGTAEYSSGSSSRQPLETQEPFAAQYNPYGGKPSFMQRWRAGDERLQAATIGRLGVGRGGRGGEKTRAASGGKRRPAFLCTILLAALLLVIIIATVVPIAVVLGNKHNNSDSGSSGDDSGDGGTNTTPQAQNSVLVTLQNGQYQGTNYPNGISSYLGLQYAAPPTGNLRWADPQPPVNHTGVKAATDYAPGCRGLGALSSQEDEDCLYLDVFAPTSVNSSSALPVYVFIQGGGLQYAATHYNASNLIIASNYQMIVVTMTYRVNAFGFLASSEIQKGGSLNVGLKDQRASLKWVQNNIKQFGGDPNHVVMGGQSGGAGSVVNQLAAYGGRNDGLYQGASMQSQSVQAIRDVASSQYQYDYIVGNTSCEGQSDTLSCLRNLDVADLVGAIKNTPFPNGAGGNPVYPYNPVLDNDFIREYPVSAFANGRFVNVPMIMGDVTDEGTMFVDSKTVKTQQDSENFQKNNYPSMNSTMLDQISTFYNFSATGGKNYWQNAAMAYGETRYTCAGIQLSNYVIKNGTKVWNYHYDVLDPAAAAAGLGVRHGSEMPAIWGSGGAPVSYQIRQQNANVIPLMQAYWTSWIKHLDPSVEKLSGSPEWKPWTAGNRLHITTNTTAMENVPSDQATRCKYMANISLAIGQ